MRLSLCNRFIHLSNIRPVIVNFIILYTAFFLVILDDLIDFINVLIIR